MNKGLKSALGIFGTPLGTWWCGDIGSLATDERKQYGCVFVLPGIEARSWVNLEIARGLAEGGYAGAIEIFDWTTGTFWRPLHHLSAYDRNRKQAALLAARIDDYQTRFPDRPVHLVGHSGGGAVSIFTLEALRPEQNITSAILLAPAISPAYDLRTALRHADRGIWSFHSKHDWQQLGIGTTIFGTLDRVRCFAAGTVGFRRPRDLDATEYALYENKLHQIPYDRAMARQWNFGGHIGCTNRVFVAQWLTPLILPTH